MTTEQTLAFRLARIMGEVGRVEKKGKITSQGSGPTYKFARDSDVMEAVTPKMAEAGIVMIPEHVELLSMGLSLSEKQFIGNIKTSWHVTDGKESLRFETFGQGADTGDKALPKAQSNARKYAFFMLYHIVTGDDPDYHGSYEQPERGERAPKREWQPPSRSSAPAPVRSAEEQALIGELLEVPGMTVARMTLLADAVGIPKGTQANADQLREMLARTIETPDGVPTEPASGGDGSSALPAAPSLDDVLAVTGGTLVEQPSGETVEAGPEGVPPTSDPAPTTVEDAIARANAKAKVKV
jgi:hypothetical protein